MDHDIGSGRGAAVASTCPGTGGRLFSCRSLLLPTGGGDFDDLAKSGGGSHRRVVVPANARWPRSPHRLALTSRDGRPQ